MYLQTYLNTAATAAFSWSQLFGGWGGRHQHHNHEVDYYARNLKTISEIYNLTVYPSRFPSILSLSILLLPYSTRPSHLVTNK